MNSFSWSANITGRKKWYMLPRGAETRLGQNVEDIVDIRDISPSIFEAAGGFTFEQKKGEIVFVPSGWYHQVHNLEVTISINHNWMNAFNVEAVFGLMLERLEACKKEVRLWMDDIEDPVERVKVRNYLLL